MIRVTSTHKGEASREKDRANDEMRVDEMEEILAVFEETPERTIADEFEEVGDG